MLIACPVCSKGTGFIGRLRTRDNLLYVLLTCHHVIPTESDAKKAFFYFGYTDVSKDPSPCNNILDTSDRWFWCDPARRNSVSGQCKNSQSIMSVNVATQ